MVQLFYILITLLLLLPLPLSGNEGEPVDVSDDFTSIKVARQCLVFLDEKGSLSFKEIIETGKKFLPAEKDVPSYGYTDTVIWISFSIQNNTASPKEIFIEVQNSIMDEVTFFNPENNYLNPKSAGDMVPFASRDVIFRNPVFRASIKPGIWKYFFKIRTTSNSNVPLIIWSKEEFGKHRETETVVLWTFYGLMIAMMLYNLIIFIFVRERDYIYYVFFIIGFILFRLSYNGLAYQYLWRGNIWWANVCVPFFVAFLALFLILFSRDFLRLREGSRLLDRSCLGLAVFFTLGMGFSLVAPYRYSIQLILGVSILLVLVLMFGGIFALKWARRQAVFYLIAWTFFLIGSFLNIFRDFGILPHNFITAWGQQIGSALQVLLLSIGLADRINTMRDTITESNEILMRVNRDLLHEREQMAVTLRSIEDGVITCGLDGKIRYMNRAMIEMLQASALEVVGKTISDVIHIFDQDDPGRDISPQLYFVNGIKETREALLYINDSDQRIVEYTVSPLKDQKSVKHGFLVVIRDISERKRLEEEMVKKNKLDAMGTLAGGSPMILIISLRDLRGISVWPC